MDERKRRKESQLFKTHQKLVICICGPVLDLRIWWLKALLVGRLLSSSRVPSVAAYSLLSLSSRSNSARKQFQKDASYDHTGAQNLVSGISIYYRKRDAARRTALFIIARYGEGDLAVFPRDLIKLIAKEVWETREDLDGLANKMRNGNFEIETIGWGRTDTSKERV